MIFAPFNKSKLLIHIAFHHSDKRIKYLEKVLSEINSYIFDTVDVIIDSNTHKDSIEKLINNYKNINISYKIHDDLKDPYLLTWSHRKNMLKHIDDYDYFLYQEDDLEITYNTLTRWLKDSQKIYPLGYIRGFLRFERKFFRKFSTDQVDNISSKNLLKINDTNYFFPSNPYHGFWIYSQLQMKKFVLTKSWKDGNCSWGIRERAAAGMIWEYGLRNILIPFTNNNTISNDVLVHHLPNNYVKNKKSQFGKIAINKLITS